MSPLRTGGWKIVGLPLIAAFLVVLSMFDCSRVSEPGVVSQKVCSDYGPPHAWPRDSLGNLLCVQAEDTGMWRGWPPNDAISIVGVTLGVAVAAYWLFWILVPSWRAARSLVPLPLVLMMLAQESTPVVFDTARQTTKALFEGKTAIVAFVAVIVLVVLALYFALRGHSDDDVAAQRERDRKYPRSSRDTSGDKRV